MKKIAKLLTLPMLLATLVGCNNKTNTDDRYQIYDLAVSAGYKGTYEEWLETIKGKDGASLLYGNGAPSAELGKTGDSYIDLDSWDFYVNEENGWIKKGNIKGEATIENEQGLAFYLLDDGTYGVGVGTANYLTDIVIPSTHKGREVTKVVDCGFKTSGEFDCSSFKSIILPNTIKEIGKFAFDCRTLEKISLPSSLTKIDEDAIYSDNLKEIKYDGTMEEFNKIEFGEDWLGFYGTITDESGNNYSAYLIDGPTFKFTDKEVSFNSLFDSIRVQIEVGYNYSNYERIIETIDEEFSVSFKQQSNDRFYCYESTDWFGGFTRSIYNLRVLSGTSSVSSPEVKWNGNNMTFILDHKSVGKTTITVSNGNVTKKFNYSVLDDIPVTVAEAKEICADLSLNRTSRYYYSITGYVSNFEKNDSYGGNYCIFLLKNNPDDSDSFYVYSRDASLNLQDQDYVRVSGQLYRYENDNYQFYYETLTVTLLTNG